MTQLVFLKLGGSVITDKATPFKERRRAIRLIAREIRQALSKTDIRLLLGHGGGSYPHIPASKFQTHRGLISHDSLEGWVLVQDAASRLNRIVVEVLVEEGLKVVSVQPSAGALARKGRIVSWDTYVIESLLDRGLIPVLYGDVVVDLDQGCSIASTEEIFRYLALRFSPSRIIVVSDVDGVYTRDPRSGEPATKLSVITPHVYASLFKGLGGGVGTDVTGGMAGKVGKLIEIAEEIGCESEIIGAKEGVVASAILGRRGQGTVIKSS